MNTRRNSRKAVLDEGGGKLTLYLYTCSSTAVRPYCFSQLKKTHSVGLELDVRTSYEVKPEVNTKKRNILTEKNCRKNQGKRQNIPERGKEKKKAGRTFFVWS